MTSLLRRLPLRNVFHHPGRLLAVVAATLLGTAMFTAAFVVGDSVDASMRAAAAARLGPIDEVVNTPDLPSALRGYSALTDGELPDVNNVIAMQLAETFVAVDSGRTEPRATAIAVDPARAAQFGLRGAALGAGEVAITHDLAQQLQVGAGGFVQLGAGTRRLPLRVARIVNGNGIAGYSTELRTRAPNLIVSADTLEALDLQPAVVLAVSDVKGHEARAHDEVVAALRDRGLFAIPAKERLLDEARTESRTMRNVLLGGAVIGLAVQLVLLVALFLLFAESHAAETQLLDALGMRPRTARVMMLTAAACYMIPAALAGVAAGVAVAAAVVQYMRGWFATGWSSESFFLHVHVTHGRMEAGCVAALSTVAVAAIAVAVVRTSRSRRRDGDSRVASRSPLRALVGARVGVGIGVAATVAGFVVGNAVLITVGPAMACLCLAPDLPLRRAPRVAMIVTGLVAMVWALASAYVARSRGITTSSATLAVIGLVVALLACVVVTALQPEFGRALAVVRRRDPAAARVAYGFPPTEVSRRAAVLAAVALVTFTVLFAAVGGGEGAPRTNAASRAAAGGYDVLGTGGSAVPVPLDAIAQMPSVLTVAPLASTVARIGVADRAEEVTRSLTVFDASLLDRRPPPLLDRRAFPSDRAAFEGVLDRPDLVIASASLLAPLAGRPAHRLTPGARLFLEDPTTGGRHEVTVAATTSADFLSFGLLTSAATATAALGHAPAVNMFLAGAGAGRAEEAARVIRGQFFTFGVDAHTVQELVGRVNHHYATYLLAVHAFQALALLVALGTIIVLTLRALRERRRALLMFHAIGATRGDVERVVITEIVFVVAQGLVLGVTAAALTSYAGHPTLRPGLPWVFPAVATLVVGGGALALTIGAAIVVARGVALRVTE